MENPVVTNSIRNSFRNGSLMSSTYMILLRRRYPLRYEQKVRYIQWYLSKLNPLGLAFVFGIWKYLVYIGLIDKDFLHWYIQDSGLFRVPFRQV